MKKLMVSLFACAFLFASLGVMAQTSTKPAEKEKTEAPAKKLHKRSHKAPMKKECEKKEGEVKEAGKKEMEKKAPEKKIIEKKVMEKTEKKGTEKK